MNWLGDEPLRPTASKPIELWARVRSSQPPRPARLDVAQISDITAVQSPDTFERTIYAGNAIATVQSGDAVKVITVRATAFDAAAGIGGSAAVESMAAVADSGLSSFVGRDVAKSDRPELAGSEFEVVYTGEPVTG